MAKSMDFSERLRAGGSTDEVIQLLYGASIDETIDDFLKKALPTLAEATRSQFVAIVAPERGGWTTCGSHGAATTVPTELLSDVLDREQPMDRDGWQAAPLAPRSGRQEVLVAHRAATDLAALDTLAAGCGAAMQSIRQRVARNRRIRRLETILEITEEWSRTRETEPLLVQMASAATRLLGADRASIFLWDRPNKTLVGRPALGVEGGELRIPDDVGVVGKVIQTGQPQRVHRKDDPAVIDRQVDEKLGYQTDTLLCVALRGSGGELFGAFEMINKLEGNFTKQDEDALIELAAHAAGALENTQKLENLMSTNRRLVDEAAGAIKMIGESPPIEALRSIIRRVADTDLAILVLGENGTGKEVASQLIHYLSGRREQPFVAVNCAAIPETLLESELFGHEKGAFTDAHDTRIGKFELATGGTLFLDEIGDLSLGGQAKMLRVLEEKVITRVGGSTPIHTDARVIAATNQNLIELVHAKKFREDLYFRLNVVTLEMPPLRDRGDDILLLAEHFLSQFAQKAGRKVPKLTAAARKRLRGHSWPGNIRELRNLTERLIYLTTTEKIDAEDLAFILTPSGASTSVVADDLQLNDATSHFQQAYIQRAVDRSGGNMSAAAVRLGLHRSNLYRKMRQLGMVGED